MLHRSSPIGAVPHLLRSYRTPTGRELTTGLCQFVDGIVWEILGAAEFGCDGYPPVGNGTSRNTRDPNMRRCTMSIAARIENQK